MDLCRRRGERAGTPAAGAAGEMARPPIRFYGRAGGRKPRCSAESGSRQPNQSPIRSIRSQWLFPWLTFFPPGSPVKRRRLITMRPTDPNLPFRRGRFHCGQMPEKRLRQITGGPVECGFGPRFVEKRSFPRPGTKTGNFTRSVTAWPGTSTPGPTQFRSSEVVRFSSISQTTIACSTNEVVGWPPA